MTDRQFNNLNMVETVLDILGEQQYASIISGNTKLSAIILAIKNTHDHIFATAGLQALISKGPTITRDSLWQDAAASADHVCSAVRAYADDINDINLLASMHYTCKSLLYVSATQSVIDMQLIHDTAAAIDINLFQDFNLVAADITGLQTAINSFEAAAPGKRVMVVNAAVATAQLPPLFALQRSQLKKLDNLVSTFRPSQRSFVETYFKGRKIIDLGKTMKSVKLHLKPQVFKSVFGKKFSEGYTFIIRNHSKFNIKAALTDTPSEAPVLNLINIPADTDLQLEVSKDFGGVFAHWLVIINPNKMDDVHVTVILTKGKSKSSAQILLGKVM